MRNGFVLSELLIAVAIIALLALVAAPSYRNLVLQNRVSAAAESLYMDLQLARSEAIRKQSDVYVAVTPGSNWCYGVSDAATCDCTTSNSCQLNGAEKVVRYSDYPGVTASVSGLGNNDVRFEGIHGTTGESGQVNFTAGSITTSTAIKVMGNIRSCSSQVGGYSAC